MDKAIRLVLTVGLTVACILAGVMLLYSSVTRDESLVRMIYVTELAQQQAERFEQEANELTVIATRQKIVNEYLENKSYCLVVYAQALITALKAAEVDVPAPVLSPGPPPTFDDEDESITPIPLTSTQQFEDTVGVK